MQSVCIEIWILLKFNLNIEIQHRYVLTNIIISNIIDTFNTQCSKNGKTVLFIPDFRAHRATLDKHYAGFSHWNTWNLPYLWNMKTHVLAVLVTWYLDFLCIFLKNFNWIINCFVQKSNDNNILEDKMNLWVTLAI